MVQKNSACGCANSIICATNSLFLKSANVRNQCLNLLLRQFFTISGHLFLAVIYGIKDALVADFSLPLGIGKIARVFQFAFDGLGPTILPMTRGTLFFIYLRGVCRRH